MCFDVASDKCYFCNENTVSDEHVFYQCLTFKSFLFKVTSIIDIQKMQIKVLECVKFIWVKTTGKYKLSI